MFHSSEQGASQFCYVSPCLSCLLYHALPCLTVRQIWEFEHHLRPCQFETCQQHTRIPYITDRYIYIYIHISPFRPCSNGREWDLSRGVQARGRPQVALRHCGDRQRRGEGRHGDRESLEGPREVVAPAVGWTRVDADGWDQPWLRTGVWENGKLFF